MSTAPPELAVHEEQGFLVCTLSPGRSRSADDAVGFFLLPILIGSTVAATSYLVLYLGIAWMGDDPAIVLVPWQGAFGWLGGLAWFISSLVLWRSAPGVSRTAELKLDTDSVTLIEYGGVGFYALLRELRGAAVIRDRSQFVQLTRDGDKPLLLPMGGNSEQAAVWVADLIQDRIDS